MSNGFEKDTIEDEFRSLSDFMSSTGRERSADKGAMRLDNAEEMMRLLGKGRGDGAPGDDDDKAEKEYGPGGASAITEGVAEEAEAKRYSSGIIGGLSGELTDSGDSGADSADSGTSEKPEDTSQQAGTADDIDEYADTGMGSEDLTLTNEDEDCPDLDFATLYPDKSCEVNFEEIETYENDGQNAWGLLNRIRESAVDEYYDMMLIDPGLYSDFDISDINWDAPWMERDDVMSISVLLIDDRMAEDIRLGTNKYAYYIGISSFSGIGGASNDDFSFEFEEDTEDDETDENEGVTSVTYLNENETSALRTRFGSESSLSEMIQQAYDSISASATGLWSSIKYNRINNDIYKFGVFSSIVVPGESANTTLGDSVATTTMTSTTGTSY